eukprot:TRINITY_DN17083_c0_g1_i1.p1 TRINITY_DN17083_c0_g1~~TRINITY_DN17083_c0_g1_i1.p1  ORF type:complete len:224 (+),score=37.56 TRINITY_DN17083_c0_g1_i1:60-674(+)
MCIRDRSVKVTDDGWCHISESISHLPKISNLTIWIGLGNGTSNRTILSISQALSSLKSLVHLTLFLSDDEVDSYTDEGITAISNSLCALSQLTTLFIGLSRNITDIGAARLFDAISSLQHISILSLLVMSDHVTNETGNKIANLLLSKVSLIDIQIDVEKTKITQDLKESIRSVGKTRQLHRLFVGNLIESVEFGKFIVRKFME